LACLRPSGWGLRRRALGPSWGGYGGDAEIRSLHNAAEVRGVDVCAQWRCGGSETPMVFNGRRHATA
jgi:hypothetical protein